MHFVIMNEEQFANFAENHSNANVYQTKEYGRLMQATGFEVQYVGIIDNTKSILAAAMVAVQSIKNIHRYAYIPGGIIIDYHHTVLLEKFIQSLKRHLIKQKIVLLKTDYMLPLNERDLNGIKISGLDNNVIIDEMTKMGFTHRGFNNYFETLKPRWNAVIDNINNVNELPHINNANLQYKVKRAIDKGISIYQGDYEYIDEFYEIIKDKNHRRNLDYYQKFYQAFGKSNRFNLYFAVFDPNALANNARVFYETELAINEEITLKLQNATPEEREGILNNKMESDKKIVIYKNDINDSIQLLQLYPKGIKVATLATITINNKVYFLIDGTIDNFKKFYPKHLLYARVIEECVKQGANYINLNAVTGIFNNPQDKYYKLHEFKNDFANKVVEYPGEFDLILNAFGSLKLNKTPEYQEIIKKQTK